MPKLLNFETEITRVFDPQRQAIGDQIIFTIHLAGRKNCLIKKFFSRQIFHMLSKLHAHLDDVTDIPSFNAALKIMRTQVAINNSLATPLDDCLKHYCQTPLCYANHWDCTLKDEEEYTAITFKNSQTGVQFTLTTFFIVNAYLATEAILFDDIYGEILV